MASGFFIAWQLISKEKLMNFIFGNNNGNKETMTVKIADRFLFNCAKILKLR